MSMEGIESLKEKWISVPSGHWLAAVSGGADSVAMLYLLRETADIHSSVECVHVNHGMRGVSSDGDELFVREMCESLRVPFHSYRVDLKGRTDENSARTARQSCFRACLKETGADGVILAHQEDDLAETFLMRLIRGAGSEGLACMPFSDKRNGYPVLRPMLRMKREEIRQALYTDGIPWREDESNGREMYLRNRIRKTLIPLMESMCPNAGSHIAEASRIIASDSETLDRTAQELLGQCAVEDWLNADRLKGAPPAVRSRVLRLWWRTMRPEMKERELNHVQTEQLRELLSREQGSLNLPGGMKAFRGKSGLFLLGSRERNEAEVRVCAPETVFGGFTLRIGPSEGNPGDGYLEQEMPAQLLAHCVIRTRRDGDRIRPFGSKGSRKLQDYLTDRGVDYPWRDRIPLLCNGTEVLLVGGVGAGGIPRWNPEADNVRLRWTGRMLWSE